MIFTDNPEKFRAHYIQATRHSSHYDLLISIDNEVKAFRSCRIILLSSPFAEQEIGYVKPIECDQARKVLSGIENSISILLERLTSIDRSIIPSHNNYYELLMRLYSARDKSIKLNKMLYRFRSICMETSSDHKQILLKLNLETIIIIKLCKQLEIELERFSNSTVPAFYKN